MRAYILLKVAPQNTAALMQELKNNEAVIEANLIHGPYDCLLEIEARDLDHLNEAVMDIRALKGVGDTLTCLVVQSWRR